MTSSAPESSHQKLQALISMLDEPDPKTYENIETQILLCGEAALCLLEDELTTDNSPLVLHRVETLLGRIRMDGIQSDIQKAMQAEASSRDLLRAWISLSRYEYQDLDAEAVDREIAQIRKDVWMEMNEHLTALEQVKVFNHVFYGIHGFQANMEDYHSPDNSFINRLLETRLGNPLSLGILYMLVARSLDLPIRGINLPEHFVLAYMARPNIAGIPAREDGPLFYINAFSKGAVFSTKEINDFLLKLRLEPIPSYLMPCSHGDIIFRMLNNLWLSYHESGQERKKAGISALISALKKSL